MSIDRVQVCKDNVYSRVKLFFTPRNVKALCVFHLIYPEEFKGMGGIAAALNKRGEDAVSLVLLMLGRLAHRGTELFHVATPTSTIASKSLDELQTKELISNTAVGHNSSLISWREKYRSILRGDYALVFEGHLFPLSKTSDIDQVVCMLKPDLRRSAETIIRKCEGSYVFAIASLNKIFVGRDSLGTNPLFCGENETVCAVASERKALWTLGIKNVKSFPPGNVAVMSTRGFDFKSATTLTQPPPRTMSIEKAARRLQSLLLKSTMDKVSGLDNVAVAFSGGLDSTVLAFLAKTCTPQVHVVTVGLRGQPELKHAQAAAESLKLPLHLATYTLTDVENALEKVLWLIEEPDMMKAGVAIPLFWTAKIASRIGCKVLLAGQGADELFGGYQRYLREYLCGGAESVHKSMFHDLVMSYETNFQRDNPVCAFHKVELRLPYIGREVIRFALSLPVNLKINSVDDPLRKRILRYVARNMGIPEFIVERTKKAVQYATGVDKALKQLARRRGLTQQDYVNQVFMKIYPNWKSEQ